MNEIKKGDEFEYSFSFSQDDVLKFADASGDYNPVHLDSAFAKKTIFKKRILHGFLGGSVFSKVFGTILPGSGTIYLKQTLSFYKPMFTGVKYKALFKIIDTISDKNRASVLTRIVDMELKVIIEGEAIIQHKNIK